jgi:hypothetical protein
MPYDNNDIMQNVPERLRSKVKGIGLPEQMPQIQQESDTSFLQDLPLPGGTSLNTVAELTSNAIDSIKETNVYKKYFYNDAEKLAEAQKISNDLKIPVNAILANDTNMEKARDIYAYKQKQQQIMPNGEKTFDMKAVYAAYPELQRLANMDETQAAIALHNIENVKQTHGIIEAFKTGWHMDSLQLERSKLGQKGYFGELTEADRKRLTEIEVEMKNAKVLPDLLEAPVESIVGNTAQQAPMMFRQFMNGQMLAIGGAVAGAAVGATGGFTVGGITAVPGAAYGARVGYGIGARLGYAKEMYQEILGNYYLDYIGYKDRQGRQLMSDNQARAWATVSALAETGIEMANVESVIGILGSEPGTKAAANIVRDIVRRGADSASAKAQLKDWIINNARNMGVVALSESAEEGVQNAVSMGINTMAAKANPGGNIPSYSAVEMAQGAMEGAWQALPASIGFGAMAAAGSNLKYVRKVATAANEGREYVENARKNEAGITMVDNLLNNKAANKLAKEQPEVYKNIIKNTLEGTGAENVYVDTELLLQQDGGVQILNQLAAAAGIEGQALQDVIETKADIAVPVQEYVNIDGAQELHDKLRDLISFAVGADCFARTRRIAQQMKKTYDKMIAGEMERALQNVHNLVEANFEEGPQRDMAEFILGQYEDPMEGIKEYRAERQRELDDMLEPVLATMREGMGQGVAMLKDEETGHYYRMSNNDPWYSKYYAENKKAPSQSEMKQIAEDILTGNNYYGVPGFEFRDAESMEYAEANRAQIESIRSELETLDAIEEKIGNISKGELAATEGLTPEGIRVYNRVIEALKGASSKAVRKQEAMGALLTAHHAERYAEAMRRAGYENYTAEDYLNRIRFEVNGDNAAGGRFNQRISNPAEAARINTVKITGKGLKYNGDIRKLRENAGNYYQKHLQGRTIYNPTLGIIRLGKGFTENGLTYTGSGKKKMKSTSADKDKLLSVPHLDELIKGSVFVTESLPYGDKHENDFFYYLHSAIEIDGKIRYVIISVKEDVKGVLTYKNHIVEDLENYNKKMEELLAAHGSENSSPGQNPKEVSSFTNSITGRAEFYKQQRVYNQPAANAEGSLIAYHNTNETALMNALESGGLAVPSIAITNRNFDYDNFGNITLVGTRDLIDPANNTDVYNRDAYTTRTPRTEYKKMKSADVREFIKKWEKEFEKIDERAFQELRYHLENGNMRSAYDTFVYSRALKYYYLTNVREEKIELPHENLLKDDIFKDEQFTEELKEIIQNREDYTDAELHKTITEKATAAVLRLWGDDSTLVEVMTDVYSNPDEHYKLLQELRNDLRNSQKPVDTYAFDRLIDSKYRSIVNSDDYMRWAKKRFEQYAGEPQIKIGSKYYPYNLENLVKAMLKNKGKGKEDTLTYSSSVVAANAARKFKSVDEIRKYADQLAKSEDVEKQIDEINELASEYQRLVAQYYKYGASSFDVFDDSMKALSKSMTVSADSTVPKLRRALESLDFENVPDDVIETGVKVANALKHAATQYFEAKPQRAVRIEEFAGAVVPKGTNPELINRLKEAGLQVEEYDKSVPGSRRAATQKVQNAAQSANGNVFFQSAYHGTPHNFEKFDLGAIGSGEGAQAHGWGLYFAADKEIADERYRKRLTNNQYVIETDEATYYFDIEKQDWVDKKTGQPVGGMGTPLGHAVWEIGFREGNVEAELKDLKGQRDALIEENDSSNAQRLDFLMRTIKLLEEKKFNYRKDNGSLFEVDIPENDVLLDENKNFDQQQENVKKLLIKALNSLPEEQRRKFGEQIKMLADSRQYKFEDEGTAELYRKKANGNGFMFARLFGDTKTRERVLRVAGYNDSEAARIADNDAEFERVALEQTDEGNKASEKLQNIINEFFGKTYNEHPGEVLFRYPQLTGEDIYFTLAKAFHSNNFAIGGKEASLHLNKNGIKGITYDGQRDGRCFVIFDDKAISIINRYNQSAGIHARTANRELLNEAQAMAAEGKMQQEIYEKTGWRRGKDGHWRFEIPDNLDKIDFSALKANESIALSEIYDNEKLYAAYPKLKNIIVTKKDLGNKVNGEASINEIIISNELDNAKAKTTLLHEVQHIIQGIENFAVGGNPYETKALMRAAIMQKSMAARDISVFGGEYYNIRRRYEDAMINGDIDTMEAVKPHLAELEAKIPNAARRNKIYNLMREAENLYKKHEKYDGYGAYKNLYGEKEARNAVTKAQLNTEIERYRELEQKPNEYIPRLPENIRQAATRYFELAQKYSLNEKETDEMDSLENILAGDEKGKEFVEAVDEAFIYSVERLKAESAYEQSIFAAEQGDAIVIFNDNLVASYSMVEPQVQGQTAILDNGRRIIYLYENADQSTFMHEMAHIFFADMRELAEMENAPAQIKRDWQTLQDWTAWNGSQINEYIGTAVYNEFNQRDKEIRAALEEGYTYRGGERIELGTLLEEWRQERFARGFEEYLRKGKAPKESLKGVFARFKNWLLKIYKDIKTIGAEPTKEVKAVMDRMLATQEEIDAVMQKEDIDAFRKAGGFKYLSGTSAEMWQKIYDDIHKDAYSKVIKVAMQDLTEQGQKEREQKIADERAAARERMSQEPVFIVWQYLQNNPQLDKEAAAQQIGNMTAEQYDFELNERGGSLDAAVDNYMRAYERELDAAAPDKAELARRAEEAVDTSYYKKLLTAYELEALDKSVRAEQKASRKINDTADAGAAQAINRLDRARAKREGYEEEIKRLREQRGEERRQQRALRDVAVGNVDTIREYAERKISTLPVMEAANPVMWKKLSRQKARGTEEAIAKNDWETARKAKKEQLVYDVMTDLATGNKKFVDKAVSTMKRRADIIRRDKNLGANDRYVYNHLLYVFGLAKRDAPIPPDYEGFVKTIVNYDQNLELTFIDTDGTVLLPDWLLNAGTATRPRDKGYIDLKVDDFKLLKDVMDNIYTAGREAKMAKAVTDRDGKKIDLDEAAAEIVTTVINTAFKKKTADRKFGDESKIEMAARLAEEASMSLIKPETILQAMGDTAMRYIYDPMREAANTEMRMNETLRQQQADIFAAYHDGKVAKYLAQGMGEQDARAAAEKELNEMGSKKQYSIGKENITKENLLAIALNWGTDINRKRVVDGYQVSYGFIEHALRQLDAADWQFVQNIWELFETYWPDLQRVEANVTGVTLEKQPAVPFQIIGADGGVYNLNGGYYPLKYDPRKNIRTSQREADEAARVNMQGASRLGMNLGNTKERVLGHVGLSIRTDLGVIDEALTDTVHNIAMRETVRDVIRLINNNEVVQAINENWGAATWRTLNAWALDCWAAEPRTKSTYEKASQWLRTRQTQAVLGFRVSTALLNICNIGPMMAYVGPAEAVKAINRFYAHPQRQYNTIMAKSVFLRNRAETMDRDFGRLVKDNSNSAITKSAFWLITKTDLMLACPLWMHEYQKAYQDGIAKGVDPVNVEAAAVRAGDAAVRRVFGSGQTVDLAAVQRGGEFEKMFTMFYSYFSVVHNAIALKVWEARKARVDGKKLTQALAPVLTGIIFWMAIPAAIEAGIRAMIDDDDDDLADVAKGAGITFISTAVGGIPVLRDVLPMALKAAAGEPVYNIRNNPLNETAAQMLNITRAINSDNKDALDVAKAVLRMADMITGLPQILTDGMITAARWIDEGNFTEEDIQHYLWSILFGKNSKKN